MELSVFPLTFTHVVASVPLLGKLQWFPFSWKISVRNFCLLISMNNPKRFLHDRKISIFSQGQHQALLSVLVTQSVIYDKIPLILEGKTLLRWASVRQGWSSAGIIYEKVMAEFLNTNRWEWEKAGAGMENILKTLRSRTTGYTEVYAVSKSSCLLVHSLIFQKYTTQNRYEARQLRKKKSTSVIKFIPLRNSSPRFSNYICLDT